ncbi:hypothetical protein GCM10017643_09630 [Ancylobacter dichloromethanicus]|uniref:Uncharacterized protein n=1 Tax=Ancylobacter dichloromethanicus TaxID=518825 RepID=A0A9W6J6W1_9HYPH|nr:hypothetical protein GCM10017643_09630 [Ancylobacter dichloromethanicus]
MGVGKGERAQADEGGGQAQADEVHAVGSPGQAPEALQRQSLGGRVKPGHEGGWDA